MCTDLPWATVEYRSPTIELIGAGAESVADRQDRVPGFSTERLSGSSVLLIGAGGLNGEIATGLARKGVGRLVICDGDLVELSNLNRQPYSIRDLFKPKALRLAKNASESGVMGTLCIGHDVWFDAASAPILCDGIDVAVAGVDNNKARAVASQVLRRRNIPAVFLAVNRMSDYGWVFVQECNGACVGCIFPRMAAPTGREPCEASPAVLDILRTLSGMALYAIDSLLMNRRRLWNFRSICLAGGTPDVMDLVNQRLRCPLCCGGAAESSEQTQTEAGR